MWGCRSPAWFLGEQVFSGSWKKERIQMCLHHSLCFLPEHHRQRKTGQHNSEYSSEKKSIIPVLTLGTDWLKEICPSVKGRDTQYLNPDNWVCCLLQRKLGWSGSATLSRATCWSLQGSGSRAVLDQKVGVGWYSANFQILRLPLMGQAGVKAVTTALG